MPKKTGRRSSTIVNLSKCERVLRVQTIKKEKRSQKSDERIRKRISQFEQKEETEEKQRKERKIKPSVVCSEVVRFGSFLFTLLTLF